MDFPGLDKSERIAQISNTQKNLTIRYRACMIATAEYRKNAHIDSSKLKLPVNDDLADSRELMYRSNAIIHVYNDIRDRGDFAEFYWEDDAGEAKPRLLLVFGKNKITDFTKTLYLDMDGTSVTLNQVAVEEARKDFEQLHKQGRQLQGGKVVIEADAFEPIDDDDDKPSNRFGAYD